MKKKMNEKKKKLQWRRDGLQPIFQFGSQYNRLYSDTAGLGAHQGAIWSSGCVLRARSRAATWPAGRDDTAGLHSGRAAARACCLATGVCRDSIVCIVARRRPCVATQRVTRAAIRRRSVATRTAACAACASMSRYSFVSR